MQFQWTHGPQAIACWVFAVEFVFTALTGFGAGAESVLSAAGCEKFDALHVIGFFG
jgi:hypothetical protein